MYRVNQTAPGLEASNKGKLVGQKLPLTLEERWAVRVARQPVADRPQRDVDRPADQRIRALRPNIHTGRCRSGRGTEWCVQCPDVVSAGARADLLQDE